jgi:hypothetical protein
VGKAHYEEVAVNITDQDRELGAVEHALKVSGHAFVGVVLPWLVFLAMTG